MFKLTGTLKKEMVREFDYKDGRKGKSKVLFIEPEDSMYPVRVSVADVDLKVGKTGDKITLDVAVFPYTIVDGKRKRAFTDFYIPNKK